MPSSIEADDDAGDAAGASGSRDAAPRSNRDLRLAALVESFLEHVRGGGALDIEPFLEASSDLRDELEPLLRGVLRMEIFAERYEKRRRT